ncbi:N-succinyldiaminopimelate aminotransferase [Corynebacterium deserti GIMN1.010]|uniref:N-succinyldiaminopimelate aminotransferase n=1 Tax=Corynebacterium deserti GIMN1.010 TaxID=931089 RepID=A0A0M4CDD4_9CORY|nr:succinyldiaminopimelate transaminase [Corynebacterium deserti]ALC05504.1 N-succinyldiaminopimelate aminotransferase [Corynebacterium deserti GIMN1.010]
MTSRTPLASVLPDFPWDSLADAKAKAASHPDGIVNLSVGTPVDPVAPSIQIALSEAAGFSGYPQTIGTKGLREAIKAALLRRYNMTELVDASVLPVVGTKEAIALLPFALGISGTVVIPEVAYPTYEVSVVAAGCTVKRSDSLLKLGPEIPSMMFINSPSNPTGKVLGIPHLRKVVKWAQENNVILAADECYLGLGWDDENPPISILDPRVCDGDHTNLIAIHSLSKTSNLASYRAGYLVGDQTLISELTEVRKNLGLMVPYPIQQAMIAALNDDDQEAGQKLIYAKRRAKLMRALLEAGFTIDDSEAGLYLWATRGEPCRDTVDWFAERGILVAPGDFYGPRGTEHVRVAMTETDERVDALFSRLS